MVVCCYCNFLLLPNVICLRMFVPKNARACQNVGRVVIVTELKSLNIVLVLFLLVAFIVSIARTVLDCVRDKKLVAISVLRMPGCLCGVRSQLNLVGLCVVASFVSFSFVRYFSCFKLLIHIEAVISSK